MVVDWAARSCPGQDQGEGQGRVRHHRGSKSNSTIQPLPSKRERNGREAVAASARRYSGCLFHRVSNRFVGKVASNSLA